MKVLRLAIEIAFVIASSVSAFWYLERGTYLLGGSVVIGVLVALVIATTGNVKRTHGNDPLLEDHATPAWILLIYWVLLVGLMIALWPGLPIVMAVRRASDARDVDAGPEAPDSEHPSTPASRSPER